jgi:hypothetical protein
MSPKGFDKASESEKQKKKDKEGKSAQSGSNILTDEQLLISPSPALESKLYRIRKWGDSEMIKYGFDVNQVNTSNFQAVGLYNKETGFGAVTNYLTIQRDDIDNLHNVQFDQTVDGKNASKKGKMDWLCGFRGKMYMYDNESGNWQTSSQIRWGTVSLGGNLVQVDGFEEMELQLRGGHPKAAHTMARLVGFRKTDWGRPLQDLLAEGLVHRCYCAYKNNQFGDTPKGIVYSPLFSPLDWDFNGVKQPGAFYLPMEYLEPKA